MKMHYLKKIVVVVFMFATINLSAQFVTPLSSISGPAEVTTLDGEVLKGDVKFASFGPSGMVSFKLKDKDGNSRKFKSVEVQQLKLKIDGLAKMEIISEQSSNLNKLAKSNFKEVVEREYIYWQRVKHPEKEKYYLFQLLNPGFDDLLKVYDLPNAKSGGSSIGGVAVKGNEATAYYVVKGGKTIKVSKKKYKKQDFKLLFGDCQQIIDNNEPDFKAFAEHVFFYNELCQ
jgi:hypothetical protein